VLINVFGASPETTNGIHTEAEPLSRNHYNKYLLQDEGCGILTDRMQIKLGEIIRDMPAADVTVDMFSFLNRLIFRAAATSLFNAELGDDDEIFQKFVAFDDVFALALAGCPMKFLAKGYEGLDPFPHTLSYLKLRSRDVTRRTLQIQTRTLWIYSRALSTSW
jgi:hypothetical protein